MLLFVDPGKFEKDKVRLDDPEWLGKVSTGSMSFYMAFWHSIDHSDASLSTESLLVVILLGCLLAAVRIGYVVAIFISWLALVSFCFGKRGMVIWRICCSSHLKSRYFDRGCGYH